MNSPGKSKTPLTSRGLLFSMDNRDEKFLIRSYRNSAEFSRSMFWKPGEILDQGTMSCCVGCACSGFLAASPISGFHDLSSAFSIYKRAQILDEFPGTEPEVYGTTIRAGLKVLQERDLIKSYYWIRNSVDAWNYVCDYGPLIFGSPWFSGMADPFDGLASPTGRNEGGHAYLCLGVDGVNKRFVFQNSWGKSWGVEGLFWMSFDSVSTLFNLPGTSVVSPVQKK